MEFNLDQFKQYEQFIYEMKESYKKISVIFKEFSGKFKDVCQKNNNSQHIMSPFKENLKTFSNFFSSTLLNISNNLMSDYAMMKDKEVSLYKERKQMIKSYKGKQNQLKIANDQYNVALKEIQKSNKSHKENTKISKNDMHISEAINFDKQRKILDRNMNNIQNVQTQVEIYAEEQSQLIFEDIIENINVLVNSQQTLFKNISQSFSLLNKNIQNEGKYAVNCYNNTIILNSNKKNFQSNDNYEQTKKKRSKSLIYGQKSDNFLYENEESIDHQNYSQVQINGKQKSRKQLKNLQNIEKSRSISSFCSPIIHKNNVQLSSKSKRSNNYRSDKSLNTQQHENDINSQSKRSNSISKSAKDIRIFEQLPSSIYPRSPFNTRNQMTQDQMFKSGFINSQSNPFIQKTGEKIKRNFTSNSKENNGLTYQLNDRQEDNSQMLRLFHSNSNQISTPQKNKLKCHAQFPVYNNEFIQYNNLNFPSHALNFIEKNHQQIPKYQLNCVSNTRGKYQDCQSPNQEDEDNETVNEFIDEKYVSYSQSNLSNRIVNKKDQILNIQNYPYNLQQQHYNQYQQNYQITDI